MKTAVITTGGMGTRLATITKSLPKTMLPIYTKSKYDNDYVLPNAETLQFSSNGIDQGILTNYTPSTDAVKYQKDDALYDKFIASENCHEVGVLSDDERIKRETKVIDVTEEIEEAEVVEQKPASQIDLWLSKNSKE